MVSMDEALAELRALTARYREPSIQDPLQRLSDDQGSEDIEDWARNLYISIRDYNNAHARSLNDDRIVILDLIYELVDLWNSVLDSVGAEAAAEFEDKIISTFKTHRIERILGFGVVMDRANALYAMKIATSSKYGMHWYSKFHFDSSLPYCNYDYSRDQTEHERQAWSQLLEGYPGKNTMNRRLFQLLFNEKMGFQQRLPETFGRWSKPQAAEFVERPNLSASILDSTSLIAGVNMEDVLGSEVARNSTNLPLTAEIQQELHAAKAPSEAAGNGASVGGSMDRAIGEDAAALMGDGKVPASIPRFSPSIDNRIFLADADITGDDIFGDRDLSQLNKEHPGNVSYLQAVAENKDEYNDYGSNSRERRALIVRIISELSGRFIRKGDDGTYYLLTEQEAKSKVSEALREKNKKIRLK